MDEKLYTAIMMAFQYQINCEITPTQSQEILRVINHRDIEIERLKSQIAGLEKQICIYIQIDNIRYCPMCDGDLTSFYLGEQK